MCHNGVILPRVKVDLLAHQICEGVNRPVAGPVLDILLELLVADRGKDLYERQTNEHIGKLPTHKVVQS